MQTENDPLWYDREEPEEPFGLFANTLLGVFLVGEFFYLGFAALARLVRTGVRLAFRDAQA